MTGDGGQERVAARAGAAASRGHPIRARVRTALELTNEKVTLIPDVRRFFEHEMSDARRIMLKKPA